MMCLVGGSLRHAHFAHGDRGARGCVRRTQAATYANVVDFQHWLEDVVDSH